MNRRLWVVLILAVAALGGCKKKAPEVTPTPTTVDADAAARERARADSIAAAERARMEAEERARQAAIARAQASLTEVVYFDYDSDSLTPEAERKLQAKAEILRINPSLRVRVAGHADERGSTEYNLALGQRRAETVRNYLARYGVDAGRLATISYGEEQPAVEGTGESSWAQNRRAEFAVTAGEIATLPAGAR